MNETASLIRDMARCERPQTRLQTLGVEAMSNAELLAVLMNLKSVGQAETLLAQHPLRELLTMTHARLKGLKNVGEKRADVLVASLELNRRSQPDRVGDLPVIQSMNDIVAHAVEIMDKKKEHLLAFFLNARHQMIAKEIISIGTLTASLAHPREIFAPAIGKAAAGVILAHNHPSGDTSPSEEDIRLTKRIVQAGHIMGIELLDHLIVSSNGCYSFKAAGQLP